MDWSRDLQAFFQCGAGSSAAHLEARLRAPAAQRDIISLISAIRPRFSPGAIIAMSEQSTVASREVPVS
jgi:hypothetical protein